MRAIYMTMAAVAALSLATPASASGATTVPTANQLQLQIDTGVSQGSISPRESVKLREKLNSLVQLERRFMPDGISGREYSILFERSAALAKAVRVASSGPNGRDDNGQVTWESRTINGRWVPDARFAGLHPGDRFSGDTRVGQHATARIVSMPVEYRNEYVANDRFYYGYDEGRVYQIDRQSQIILALLDIARN
jgi:hypothetical protein